MYLPRAAKDQRRPSKPHDHVYESPGLAIAVRVLRECSRCGGVCRREEPGGIYLALDDPSALWWGNILPSLRTDSGFSSDVEESAVAKVLSSLTSLCELGLFEKMRLWELMGATLGFLYHPNIWIRQSTSFDQYFSLKVQLVLFASRCSSIFSLSQETPPIQRRVVYPIPLLATLPSVRS